MRVTTRTPLGIFTALLALLVVACGTNSGTQSEATVRLDPGTEIKVSPLAALSPATDKVGSQFTATLAEPLQQGDQVVAPKGSTVVGEVLEAQGEPGQTGSFLSLQLKEITVNGGQSVALKTDTVRYTPAEQGASTPGEHGMAPENPANQENPAAAKQPNEEAEAPPAAPEQTVMTFRLAEPVDVPLAGTEGAAKPLS